MIIAASRRKSVFGRQPGRAEGLRPVATSAIRFDRASKASRENAICRSAFSALVFCLKRAAAAMALYRHSRSQPRCFDDGVMICIGAAGACREAQIISGAGVIGFIREDLAC